MITEARTVKSNQFDTSGFGLFGYALANQAGGGSVAAIGVLACKLFANFGLQRRGADEHTIAFRRNNVCVDVQIRAENTEAMHTQFADFPTGRCCTTQTGGFLVHDSSLPARLFLLGFFKDDALIGIPHAFAFVRLGFAIGTNFSGYLSDRLLVGALYDEFRLGGALDLDASRHFVFDVVGKAKLQLERIALNLGAETHTDQVEPALEPFADADNRVVDKRADRARHGVGMFGVTHGGKGQLAIVELDLDIARQGLGQGAQRALDRDLIRTDRGFDATWHGKDRKSTRLNSSH